MAAFLGFLFTGSAHKSAATMTLSSSCALSDFLFLSTADTLSGVRGARFPPAGVVVFPLGVVFFFLLGVFEGDEDGAETGRAIPANANISGLTTNSWPTLWEMALIHLDTKLLEGRSFSGKLATKSELNTETLFLAP